MKDKLVCDNCLFPILVIIKVDDTYRGLDLARKSIKLIKDSTLFHVSFA